MPKNCFVNVTPPCLLGLDVLDLLCMVVEIWNVNKGLVLEQAHSDPFCKLLDDFHDVYAVLILIAISEAVICENPFSS